LSEIRVSEGEVAPVGAVVAVIADGSVTAARAAAPAAKPAAKPTASAAPQAAPPAPATPQRAIKLDPFFEVRTPAHNFGPARLPGGTTVTPLARRLAAEAGIDLARTRGSGPHGRIVARDIENAPQPSRPAAGAVGPSAAEIMALYAPDSYTEVPLDGMRRTIATRLTQAATVPHFYLTADIAIDRLIALREEANNSAPKPPPYPPPQAGEGRVGALFKLSLNDFVIRALALALQRVPAANAVWAADRILRFTHSDIGVAVALDGGLITPVIRGAEAKSVTAISGAMKELAVRARDKKLKAADYQGGSSAISNLGIYGVREFTAIINPPHATILAVGAARRQAVETDDGGVKFVGMMSVTLSCDHRVVDGALGAELLAAFKTFIEMPVTMLV
jgi:pyruvate dehydrogenase E2 component (dihydrolipoamide acetyltransferase)